MTDLFVSLMIGDVRDRLAYIPDNSVHCVVTSPPYWGLRDYGVPRQLGLEPTLAEHIENMVDIFREVRRVLRKDGTCWVNYGDCYATSANGRSAADTKAVGTDDRTFRDKPFSTVQGKMKPKDLCMVPNRFAIAMQDDGWWVRSEIIWHKPNPMPESITDRPGTSHEKVWLFTKSKKYWYDATAVRTKAKSEIVPSGDGWATGPGSHSAIDHNTPEGRTKQDGHGRRHDGFNERWKASQAGSFKRENSKRAVAHPGQNNGTHRPDREDVNYMDAGANLKNVWSIATQPFSGAHFATFPHELPEICIKAGTSEKGVCSKCGAPFNRISEKTLVSTPKACRAGVIDGRDHSADRQDQGSNRQKDGHIPGMANNFKTIGWEAGCKCGAPAVPATVLDPFGGSGTTALVAHQLLRNAILIELNAEYAALTVNRLRGNLIRTVVHGELPPDDFVLFSPKGAGKGICEPPLHPSPGPDQSANGEPTESASSEIGSIATAGQAPGIA